MRHIKIKYVICMLILSCVIMSGCTNPLQELNNIEIVKELKDDELFTINGESCTVTEAKVFLLTQKNVYEPSYGTEIWESKFGGSAFSNYIKGDIKTFLTRFTVLKLMADDYKIKLSDEDINNAELAAKVFYEGLTDSEKNYIEGTKEDILNIFKDFRRIENYLNEFTKDVYVEISEDDARVITIQNILISTSVTDDAGNRIEMDESQKKDAYEKAKQVYNLSVNGSDFGTLADQYSDASQTEINLEREMIGGRFDEIAFSLEEGQIGAIVETEYGYHIIKCIDSYNEALTSEHKEEMLAQYKSDYYEEAYSNYIQGVKAQFNDSLWNRLMVNVSLELSGTDFFAVYYDYFE